MKQYGIAYAVANFESEMLQLKSNLEIFIKDRDIPLVDRWDIWRKSPDCLKNTCWHSYNMLLGKIDLIDRACNDLERRETIDVVDFLYNEVDSIYCELEDELGEGNAPPRGEWEPEGLEVLQEKILADNMGFFCYDW
jgi:hypothetical protein